MTYMLKMRPQLESRPLNGPADVGLLTQIAGDFAISAVFANDPERRLQFVAFDPATKAFTHHEYSGETALIFRGEVLFEPDLSRPIPERTPSLIAGSDVFFDGKELYVVVRLQNRTDWRLVTLGGGNIVTSNDQPMHVFPSYRMGVRSADGDIAWVFQV
jgi:hypothetical protein